MGGKKNFLRVSYSLEILVLSAVAPIYSTLGGTASTNDNLDGTFTVSSYDNITRIQFADNTNIQEVDVFRGGTLTSTFNSWEFSRVMTRWEWHGECNLLNMEQMLSDCYLLNSISLFDTSSVTNWRATFYYCSALVVFPLFDTSSATDFRYCFSRSGVVDAPLFTFSVPVAMGYMFQYCQSLVNFPAWDMFWTDRSYQMFQNCYNLETVSATNIRNAQLQSMFSGCGKLTCITEIDTTLATAVGLSRISGLFNACVLLTNPSPAEQTVLTTLPTGGVYVNASPCP